MTVQSEAGPHTAQEPSLSGQYLTFRLGDEEYGVPVMSVREIVGVLPVTPLPGSDPAVLGVVNLRGSVIPVIDLRRQLRLPSVEPTPESCIVVLENESDGKRVLVGALVDRVAEVRDLDAAETALLPELGARVDTRCLMGLGRVDDCLVILLHLPTVLAGLGSAA